MRTKHIFVPALDVGELLPFVIRPTKTIQQNMQEQERARAELTKFIDILEKNLRQPIWYMGMDVIGEKNYERFMFEQGGFFEVMIEPPLAMNAHFVDNKQAEEFKKALQKTLKTIMKASPVSDMFIESISVEDESDEELKVQSWTKMKEVHMAADEEEKGKKTKKNKKR
jgi:hypothetical protein